MVSVRSEGVLHVTRLALSTILFVGCSKAAPTDTSALPPQDTATRDTGTPWEFVDTGGAANPNDTPTHTLTLEEWGDWTLSPPAATTYTSLSGSLKVQEYLDGLRPDTGDTADTAAPTVVLDCDVVYQVSGVPDDTATCADCDFTFRIEFALLSGDPSQCHDPDLPQHQDQWTVGYDAATGKLMRDYGDTGLWFPWYDATMDGDVLTLAWEVTVGVSVQEPNR